MSRGQQPVIRFDCVTIFPEMFAAVTQSGITRRALEEALGVARVESTGFRRQCLASGG